MNIMNIYENHKKSLTLWISMKINEHLWKWISMKIFEYHVKSMKQININNIYTIVNSCENMETSMKFYDNVYKYTNIIEIYQHVWISNVIKKKNTLFFYCNHWKSYNYFKMYDNQWKPWQSMQQYIDPWTLWKSKKINDNVWSS